MTDLEKKYDENLNVKYGVFTGNGTTAMYLVFKALNLQDKKVIFQQYLVQIRLMQQLLLGMRLNSVIFS